MYTASSARVLKWRFQIAYICEKCRQICFHLTVIKWCLSKRADEEIRSRHWNSSSISTDGLREHSGLLNRPEMSKYYCLRVWLIHAQHHGSQSNWTSARLLNMLCCLCSIWLNLIFLWQNGKRLTLQAQYASKTIERRKKWTPRNVNWFAHWIV